MPLEDVPKRTVPDHIPKPDYATEGERSVSMSAPTPAEIDHVRGTHQTANGISFGEQVAFINERQGRTCTPEEIVKMRRVCKVCAASRLTHSVSQALTFSIYPGSSAARYSTSPLPISALASLPSSWIESSMKNASSETRTLRHSAITNSRVPSARQLTKSSVTVSGPERKSTSSEASPF